jgi:non-ribosomal peptide synthetase component F
MILIWAWILRYDTYRMQRSAAPLEARTIPALARAAAARFGEASAVEDGAVRLSFAGLWSAALRATRAFLAAGIEPGDRVAIWAPNFSEWIAAAWGRVRRRGAGAHQYALKAPRRAMSFASVGHACSAPWASSSGRSTRR